MKTKLLENTVMLYIMKFGGYLFSFLIVPYQTRVLSQDHYGALSLALGMMMYFTMLIDYGFMVSGVTEVAEHRNDIVRLRECITCVVIVRLFLSALSYVILTVVVYSIEAYTPWSLVFYLYLAAVALEALLPTFFLRGVEDMRTVALLTLFSKAIATMLVFVLVQNDADYFLVPVVRIIGAFLSLIIAWVYISRKYQIKLVRVSFKQVLDRARESFGYFVSRIASTVYRSGNTVILGMLYPTAVLALYSGPQKILDMGMGISAPLSDSLLPHISKSHDYKSAWRIMELITPAILAGGIIGFIWAEPMVVWLFGEPYRESASVLRAMIPVIAITPYNHILAFPVLVPMGLRRYANMANVVGAVVWCGGMLMLWSLGSLDILSAALLLGVTELSVTLCRLTAVLANRNRLKVA